MLTEWTFCNARPRRAWRRVSEEARFQASLPQQYMEADGTARSQHMLTHAIAHPLGPACHRVSEEARAEAGLPLLESILEAPQVRVALGLCTV